MQRFAFEKNSMSMLSSPTESTGCSCVLVIL